MKVTVIANTAAARSFLVEVEGTIGRPKSLHVTLDKRFARALQGQCRTMNKTPNRFGSAPGNFRMKAADATPMTGAGAVVTIAEARYRIHLFGVTIKM